MVGLHELVNYSNSLLDIASFQDYCPNGLQVEGRSQVATLVSGVTASQALITAAIAAGADAILVHHGYFWKGEEPVITGLKRRRIQALLQADISLIAYHLPLDAHAELGNNAQLAQMLSITIEPAAATLSRQAPLVMRGRLAQPMTRQAFSDHLAQRLGREPQLVAAGSEQVTSVAWCSGAAQGYITQAAAMGVDAYLSGEISEQTWHQAHELGINYYAAGHHATERYGVQALAGHLAEQFGLQHRFIDIPNPV